MKQDTVPSPWLTTAQAAAYLCVSRRYLEDLRLTGEGPLARRLGRRLVRYNKTDLDNWLQIDGAAKLTTGAKNVR